MFSLHARQRLAHLMYERLGVSKSNKRSLKAVIFIKKFIYADNKFNVTRES